jgi:hypothetical protein
VLAQLVVGFVVEAFDGGVLDGSVHSLDLTIRPRVPGLGGSVIDVAHSAGVIEGMSVEELAVGDSRLDEGHGQTAGTRRREVDAIVGRHGVYLVGHSIDEPVQDVVRSRDLGLFVQFDKGELADPVDCHEHVGPAPLGADLGDVDVEEADRVALERAPTGLVASDLWQLANPMALQTTVQ